MNSIRTPSFRCQNFDWCVDGSTFERQNIWSTLPSSHFGIGSILDHGILSAESLEELCTQVSW